MHEYEESSRTHCSPFRTSISFWTSSTVFVEPVERSSVSRVAISFSRSRLSFCALDTVAAVCFRDESSLMSFLRSSDRCEAWANIRVSLPTANTERAYLLELLGSLRELCFLLGYLAFQIGNFDGPDLVTVGFHYCKLLQPLDCLLPLLDFAICCPL